LAPRLASLRRSAVHNDLNDNNVLVAADGSLHERHQQISGILDFGDMVFGYTVADLAVACAYVMLGATDPLAAAASVVRGYHRAFPLDEDELSALFGLMVLRLCMSACLAAHQQRQDPHNAYLDVSQAAIRQTLPALASVPFALARALFRDACGLVPVAGSAGVSSWLRANTARFAPVLGVDLRTAPCTVFDLGVGSALVSGDSRENAEPELTRRIGEVLREDAAGTGAVRTQLAAGAETARTQAAELPVGIGRYNEPRLLYTAPIFAGGTGPDSERRTIHIGLDLFAPAGTPVHAPMDGTVHAVADNRAEQDYGPVIVLRHAPTDDVEFFTLYGHLSRESLAGKRAGQSVARGEQIAKLGAPDVNGGWTPHLHLQVITDLLGFGTDFPGVAPASQRAAWLSLSPDPNLIMGVPEARFPRETVPADQALARRRRHVGGNLSVAYRDPLRMVRGWKQYLFDDEGRRYLDAYNNVPHVGHSHPRVVHAAAAQMRVLNTNTRYLNDQLAEYAERLVATLPAPLEVCVLLNSASEANELAVRMARAFTHAREMIVLEAAYHGNTSTLIDLSPYKHAGPGGTGAPDWVHVAPLPDDYRGAYRRSDAAAGAKYAAQVAAIVGGLRDRGRALAGFIAETCPSVGGQVMLPAGYLKDVYACVRASGGVCIADEVQTGLGRIGTHFWAFEAHAVVPDIVVMGKPLGNGHPLAAVVCTRAIADAFDNGMEFFSTFGGNNVSCAVGLAVLDVLRDEGLQAHALAVGNRLIAGLSALKERHPMVGDVRGSGLFIGVELVRDRDTLEPATEEAAYVANRMREEGILLGTDGPRHNVIKIRPPMPFDAYDADRLVVTFERIVNRELT
jgi:4-aminobutyrate aminotransferase-like enzyme